MKTTTRLRLRLIAVWAARIVVGATFILSGWAKAIDPWGFLLKVNEYLAVWDFSLPREAVLTACVTLSCLEFACGILIAAGALKRVAVWGACAMMAVMLPLTAYIYIADPVADCGCFGDFMVLSNGATFLKNIVLTALLVYLVLRNRSVRGLYPAPIQWLVVAVSLGFPLYLAFVGYQVQPVVDFRPYPLGSLIFAPENGEGEAYYIYEKEGQEQRFTLDALPDSTWTYVDAVVPESFEGAQGIAVYDRYGNDVADEIVDLEGPQIYLVVLNPGIQFLSRSHYVGEIYAYAREHGIGMVGVVASSGPALAEWVEWVRPRFPVYSAEDTSLKQLVRGDAALVYTEGGEIKWKRSLATVDIPFESETAFEDVEAIDNGRLHLIAVLLYLGSLLCIWLLGLSPRILALMRKIK